MDAALRERVIEELRRNGYMETVRRLSLAETADRLGPALRALNDAGFHGDAAVLRITVAWWQTFGLPDD